MVKAATFLAWWRRITEINQRLPLVMTDEEWRSRGQVSRTLLADLQEVGEVAGAVLSYAHKRPDGSMEFGKMLNPAFDWQHGEVDLQGALWSGEFERASGLIKRLVKVTGIPE
jgi:hypothetical protein